MPEFKEHPKVDRPKSRPATIPPKQAARILAEKYRQQLDQRPEGSESETTDATDRIGSAGRQAVDEVMSHSPRPSHRQNPLKQKAKPDTPKGEPTTTGEKPKVKTHPKSPLKTKEPQEQAKPRQSSANTPRQRTTPAVKKPANHAPPPITPGATDGLPRPSSGLTRPQEAGRQAFVSQQRSRPRGQLTATSGSSTPTKPPKVGRRPSPLKNRPRTIFKNRASVPGKRPGPAPKVKPVTRAAKAVKQTAQWRMKQQAVARAKQAAKVAVDVGRKVTIAVAKAMASLVSNLVGLLGGSVLLVILIFIVAVAAVAGSPFGIFFSGERGTGGSVSTVSVSEAVGSVNVEYNTKLEQLQTGDYDGITLTGQAADWPDVLAVFASRYAAAEDGVDVATLDADRVDKLTATFWDMTSITSYVESIDHPDSDPDDEIDDSWTEHILHITVTPKTAEEMKTAYSFTDFQISALDELMADPAALASLAGSLEITNTEAKSTLDALPMELSADRKKAVETALQLVGKVNYFWGGKSSVIGWDSRWGQLTKVTADGSPSTGTYRPYGLDCTGFIDWTLRNAGLPSDGHWYVGTNLTEVTPANALPGDIALYPDNSHVGMVVGRNGSGKLLICHCSSGHNNVVVTEYTTSGFTALGRPGIYSP